MKKEGLKSLFIDICNGFSWREDIGLYFKHPSIFDEAECEREREIAEERARKNGLEKSEEILKDCIKNGSWSNEKEKLLAVFERDYKRLNQTRFAPISEKQLKSLREEINSIEKEWIKVSREKEGLFENSIEKHGDRAFNDKMVFLSLFKDRDLTKRAFGEEDFEYLDDAEFYKISRSVFIETRRFSTDNISNLVIQPFFQRRFSISNSAYDFFEKPVGFLTEYQISLIKLGEKFKSMMAEISEQLEEDDTPEEIEDLFYLNRAGVLKTKEQIAKENAMWR